ncbi:MAG: site-specific integrase [Flavisolibacter sp.]
MDGIRKEISIGRQIDPEKWNANAGYGNGTKAEIKSLNAYVDTLRTKVYEVRRTLLEKNETITTDALRHVLKGTGDKSKMILKIFQDHNDQMKSLVGKDFSPATLERYKTSLEHTQAFMRWKYGVSDMDLKKMNYDFVEQYEFWLKTIRNCNHNTALKYISNFRKIVNRCIRSGWLDKDPFVGFKMTKKEVVPEFLTEYDLNNIMVKKFGSDRLSQVRDIFIFCCYTGLAFADVKKLKVSEIGIGIDGSKWIFTNRQKTATVSKIPLLPIALYIINKYKDNPFCINTNKVLPVLSNQKYNESLKEISTICAINKKMTSHTARHTFATTITLSNGVPMESVSKMLGHKNLKTTQHYAKVLDKKISDDMNILKDKMLKKRSLKSIGDLVFSL